MILNLNGKKVKLPDFFLAGVAKSGTTSLAKYLSAHPKIFIPEIKEPHFFSFYGMDYNHNKPFALHYIKNLKNYIELFENLPDNQILGDASTSYSNPIWVDRVIENIIKVYQHNAKKLKFIFIIRNHLERLISLYKFCIFIGLEDLPFEKALSKCKERVKKGYRLELNYIDNMFVADSIRKYIETFGRENIKIYLFEDLKKKPIELLKDIFSFLGVDENFEPKNLGKIYNKSYLPKNIFLQRKIFSNSPSIKMLDIITPEKFKENYKNFTDFLLDKNKKNENFNIKLTKKLKKKLLDLFKDDILKLQDLINRDLSHWLKVD